MFAHAITVQSYMQLMRCIVLNILLSELFFQSVINVEFHIYIAQLWQVIPGGYNSLKETQYCTRY